MRMQIKKSCALAFAKSGGAGAGEEERKSVAFGKAILDFFGWRSDISGGGSREDRGHRGCRTGVARKEIPLSITCTGHMLRPG